MKNALLTLMLLFCSCVDVQDTEIEYVNVYIESDERFSLIGGASWAYPYNPYSPIQYQATVTNMGMDTLVLNMVIRGYIWDADSLVVADCTAIVIENHVWIPKEYSQFTWQSMYEYDTMSPFEYWGMSIAVNK